MPGNIIQTPQPATVRSVGCIFLHLRTKIAAGYVLILFVIFGIVYIWLNEQEEIEEKIAKQVPVIARKSTREKPQKRKRTGFLGLFILIVVHRQYDPIWVQG